MHDKHVMIDLETLSTENDAELIAIGAVEFDLDKILQERLWLIDPQLVSGRRDNATINWWNEQNPSTAREMFGGKARESDVAAELFNWMTPFHKTHWIWAGPSTFDLSILKTWYRFQGLIYPINWRNERDLTTISRIADELKIDYSGEEFPMFKPHNARADAIKQARRTQIILKSLEGRNQVFEAERAAYSNRPGL